MLSLEDVVTNLCPMTAAAADYGHGAAKAPAKIAIGTYRPLFARPDPGLLPEPHRPMMVPALRNSHARSRCKLYGWTF